MDLKFLRYIPKENLKKWTKLTLYCYKLNCICKDCDYFPEDYKKICKVKLQVLLLYRKFGKPKINKKDNIIGDKGC